MAPLELAELMPEPHGGAQVKLPSKSSQQLETHLNPEGQPALLVHLTALSQK